MSSEPLLHHKIKVGLTIPTTAVFIVGEIAGTGVLALPKAIEDTGIIGIFLLLFFTILSAYTGALLGKAWTIAGDLYDDCKGHVPDPYPLLGEKMYGKFGRYIVSFSINCSMFGGAIVFLLLASGNVENLVEKLGVDISFCFWLLILGGCLLPLTWFGTPKDFWPVAIGATGATGSACIIMIILMASDHSSSKETVQHSNIDIQNFAMAIGTIVFALAGHPAFPTFQADMKRQTDFKWAIVIGFFIIFCMYIPVASTGYAIYGNKIKANVLDSVTPGALCYAALILVTIHLTLAFIIVLNPVCQEFEKRIHIPKHFTWKRCASRTFLVAIIVFIAETIPRFNAILSLIGGSVLTILGFICPTLFYMKVCRLFNESEQRKLDKTESTLQVLLERGNKAYLPLWMKVMNYEIAILGGVIGIAASISAVISIVSPNSLSLPCYVNITGANT